ncbi:MAG: hypothetical protein HXX09_12460 [Bacteroidetes bacterium]|nr:hypothetical protein [Bacteroidota bacterium]
MKANIFKILFFLFISAITPLIAQAQQLIPLNNDLLLPINKEINKKNILFHTSMKPYLDSDLNIFFNHDSLVDFSKRDFTFINKWKHPWFWRKLRRESLININSKNFHATADPFFNLELGKEKNSSTCYVNTRGYIIKGKIGNHFAFNSSFYENQGVFPKYLGSYIDSNLIVPGQGKAKAFKSSGYDYSMVSGVLSYSPFKCINFQFGTDKNFIGDGYRSLLLSDNAFNYPFLKITTNYKKLQYMMLFSSLQDLKYPVAPESPYQKKYSSTYYLSYFVGKRIDISLFESVMWQAVENKKSLGLKVNYFNPIIGYQSISSSLNSVDNSMLGLNLKIKLTNTISYYSQCVIDNLSAFSTEKSKISDKYGFQFGFKYFDLFGLKNLYLQTEYNQVQPYTYGHKNSLQSYTHYDQPMAHPMGANFKEAVAIMNYRWKDFFAEVKINYILFGADTGNSHYGNNIFQSDNNAIYYQNGTPVILLEGISTKLIIADLRLSYLMNPKTNMNLILGYTYRKETSDLTNTNTSYVYFGFRTSLTNFYYDFK